MLLINIIHSVKARNVREEVKKAKKLIEFIWSLVIIILWLAFSILSYALIAWPIMI